MFARALGSIEKESPRALKLRGFTVTLPCAKLDASQEGVCEERQIPANRKRLTQKTVHSGFQLRYIQCKSPFQSKGIKDSVNTETHNLRFPHGSRKQQTRRTNEFLCHLTSAAANVERSRPQRTTWPGEALESARKLAHESCPPGTFPQRQIHFFGWNLPVIEEHAVPLVDVVSRKH